MPIVKSKAALHREACRLLRPLALPGRTLKRLDADTYGLFKQAGVRKPAIKASAILVHAFRAEGWLEPGPADDDSLQLSAEGEAFLRRALADADPFASQHRVLGAWHAPPANETAAAAPLVNKAETPLGWLAARRGAARRRRQTAHHRAAIRSGRAPAG